MHIIIRNGKRGILKKKDGCICSVNNDGRKRHKDETYCFMCWKKIHIVFYSDCYTCKN